MLCVLPRGGRRLLSSRPPAKWPSMMLKETGPQGRGETSSTTSSVLPYVYLGIGSIASLFALELGTRDESYIPEVLVNSGVLDVYKAARARLGDNVLSIGIQLYHTATATLSGNTSSSKKHSGDALVDESNQVKNTISVTEEQDIDTKEEITESTEEKEARMVVEALETIAADEALTKAILKEENKEESTEKIIDTLQVKLARLNAEEVSRPELEASRARECVREACDLGMARKEAALVAARECWSRREALALTELEREFSQSKAAKRSIILAEADANESRQLAEVSARWENWRQAELAQNLAELSEKKRIAEEAAITKESQDSGDAALSLALRLRGIASRVAAARTAAFDVAGDDATARSAHARLALDLLSSPSVKGRSDSLRERWSARVLPNALAAAKRPAVDNDAPLFDAAIGSIVAKIELASGSTVLSQAKNDSEPLDRDDVALHLADAAIKRRDLESALSHLDSIKDPKTNSILRDWKLDATTAATAIREKQLKDARALILAAARSDALSP